MWLRLCSDSDFSASCADGSRSDSFQCPRPAGHKVRSGAIFAARRTFVSACQTAAFFRGSFTGCEVRHVFENPRKFNQLAVSPVTEIIAVKFFNSQHGLARIDSANPVTTDGALARLPVGRIFAVATGRNCGNSRQQKPDCVRKTTTTIRYDPTGQKKGRPCLAVPGVAVPACTRTRRVVHRPGAR